MRIPKSERQCECYTKKFYLCLKLGTLAEYDSYAMVPGDMKTDENMAHFILDLGERFCSFDSLWNADFS